MLLTEIIFGGILAAILIYYYRGLSNRGARKFFANTLVLAALIYVGFALVGFLFGWASISWLLIEFLGVAIYFAFARVGLRRTVWLLSLGWAFHVFWDIGLHFSDKITFVPSFYPGACIGFDLVFAAYIACRFLDRRN